MRRRIPSWMFRGACLELDVDQFFPERGEDNRPAKRICAGCPVREPCLDYALATDQRWGVWGGLSWQERRKLRKKAA